MVKRPSKNSNSGGRKASTGKKAPAAVDQATPGGKSHVTGIPVVGIGASAGGLEALNIFFEAMPADSGSAFVVVIHLDPTRNSSMAELLSHHTSMPVHEIEDGMRLEADNVYVIVPDRYVAVRHGALHLYEPPEERGHRHPVDALFRSLAEDRQERTVAIILSGTGTNGTDGLKDIKSEGGMILVQSPDSAKFDGMPRSAIASNLADHVLAPNAMPEVLGHFLAHGYISEPDDVEAQSGTEGSLETILEILNVRARTDFHGYKRSTLGRRVHRRLGLANIQSVEDYAAKLREDPGEVTALINDLMIGVTGFYRDRKAWEALEQLAIKPLVEARDSGAAVRVWVPGCSTGEEAYSIAMAIQKAANAAGKQFELKIFATDAQEEHLRRAREGIYPEAAMTNIPRQDRQRYFEKLDGSYQVRRELRDLVMFANHNLLRDPPFSRMDLITCRNLLIYIEPSTQHRVIALCHFALREGGCLFLGNAETIGRHDELFETISKKWRIYRRIGPTRHDIIDFPVLGRTDRTRQVEEPSQQNRAESASEITQKALIAAYAPASVLIDNKGRTLYFHGDTTEYLTQPSGEPTKDIHAMVRDGLGAALRAAIREATQTGKRATATASSKSAPPVSVNVVPAGAAAAEGQLLVSFEPAGQNAPPAAPRRDSEDASEEVTRLRDDLVAARADLQSTIEEMESSNEELKASNEEVTSMNEELQSANEELETSKEELQSFNEELQTVNNQLQQKIKELEATTNDLDNLLAGTEVATLFLDNDLAIKWFTPQMLGLFDLQSSDVGRPINHFARKFADENLVIAAEQVLKRLTANEAEVKSASGRWFMRRILPYRTRDNRIEGVVITFNDITELKQRSEAIDEARLYAETIVETISQPLIVLDQDLRVQSANDAFYRTFETNARETEDRLIQDIGNGQWHIPELTQRLGEVLSADKSFRDLEIEHTFQEVGLRSLLLNGRKLDQNSEHETLILLAIEDITERKAARAHQQLLIGELNHRVKNVLATVQAVATQSLRTAASLDTAREAITSRLQAMAKAHDLLTTENWAGTDIAKLVRDAAAYDEKGDRFHIEGPRMWMPPSKALSLAMALHELSTNAAKYGALSVPGGHVDLKWSLDGESENRRIHLRWEERDGPAVTPPTRQGFGTRLIERALAMELNAEVSVSYDSTGVVCTIDAPVPSDPAKATLRGD